MTASTPPTSEDRLDRIEQKIDMLATGFEGLSSRVDTLSSEVERSNDKFDTYQKATQWVVQVAFTLIASATITVLVSTVLGK